MNDDEVNSLIASTFPRSSVPDKRYSDDDTQQLIAFFRTDFPAEFVAMRASLNEFIIPGDHLPANEMIHDYGWEVENNPNFTEDFIPFYAVGNGDYLCLSRRAGKLSPVLYVAHDDPEMTTLHKTFADYLRDPDWFYGS